MTLPVHFVVALFLYFYLVTLQAYEPAVCPVCYWCYEGRRRGQWHHFCKNSATALPRRSWLPWIWWSDVMSSVYWDSSNGTFHFIDNLSRGSSKRRGL